MYIFLVPETKGKSAGERTLHAIQSAMMTAAAPPPSPAKPYGGSLILNDVMIITNDKKRKISLFVITTGKSGKLPAWGHYKSEVLKWASCWFALLPF